MYAAPNQSIRRWQRIDRYRCAVRFGAQLTGVLTIGELLSAPPHQHRRPELAPVMPAAPDNLEWVAWDAIRSRQDRQDKQDDRQDRKRLEAQLGEEGRQAKRARFGDG